MWNIIACSALFLLAVSVQDINCVVDGTDRTEYCENGGILTSCQCACKPNYWGANCEKSSLIGGCEYLAQVGIKKSGVYNMTINGQHKLIYCDVCTETGYPWTVIQRRINGRSDFYQKWNAYANGFGNPDDEFWFGNTQLAELTATERYVLRIELTKSPGVVTWAEYDDFRVGNVSTKFKLDSIGQYSGNAGDSLSDSLGMMFSTYDNDNDLWSSNCALSSYCYGAWWYRLCSLANLNGNYGSVAVYSNLCGKGVNWHSWTGYAASLTQTVMMIRPYRLGVATSPTTTTKPTSTTNVL